MFGFIPREALARVDAMLARPPALARIVRPVPMGERVARFVLPMDACKPQNNKQHGQAWRYARDNNRVAMLMGAQARRPERPLPGRPLVLCVRFSSVEPDAYADWAKAAVDVLTLPSDRARNRLGFIVDDKPRYATVIQRWEPAPPKQGLVLIEVYEGDPGADILDGKKPRKRCGGGDQEGRRA